MTTEPDLQSLIIDDLKSQDYFSVKDNGTKTRIRAQLAEKYKVEAVWIKDVVINGYGKEGRRIEDSKIVDIFGSNMGNVSIFKTSEDPAEGTATFEDLPASVFFVSSAPGQVGIGLMKIMNALKKGNCSGLIIVNNGNEGPLPDIEFNEIKATFDKLGIYSAGVYNGGISHKPNKFELITQKNIMGVASLQILEPFISDMADSDLCFPIKITQRTMAAMLSKRFQILTGLAGSGKTKLAQALARWITPTHSFSDPFTPGATLEAARKVYKVNDSDRLGVEFLSDEGTKVLLPRAIIEQWANYINQNNVSDAIGAQELRDKIKASGGEYSAYLQNFETHYKPAAFSLLKARKSAIPAQCYEVVPVGADWTGNENILGYPDGLNTTHYVNKPALDLILNAAKNADVPHFLILDEMNLSHVERYFADILSAIESDEGLELYSGDTAKPETWRKTTAGKPVPPRLKQLPENLFIIGTVNVDETTYMFSPKVLDRANVIEFRLDSEDLQGFLSSPSKPDLAKLDGKGVIFGKAFVEAAKKPVDIPADVKAVYDSEMLLFFETLQDHGAEFGYRTAYETARFIHYYKLLGNHADGDTTWFHGAFDCVILQKMLPKLHGSRAKLGPILKTLWFLCVNEPAGRGSNANESAKNAASSTDKQNEPSIDVPAWAPYPLSAEKIGRMWRLLIENGFASFAEA
jgi:hypothetical protein